jgi:FkbM family methyltransferase
MKYSFVLPALILAVLIAVFNEMQSHPCLQGSLPSLSKKTSRNDTSLGNGCYHVFIDAGSNVGVHGRFLFEPEKYPKSKFAGKFDELLGNNRTLQNVCVFAFEPNPKHRRSQSTTELFYNHMGWRYHYMPFGVSDKDGNLTFYHNTLSDWGGQCEEWGFSMFPTAVAENQTKFEAVSVNIVNVSAWMETNILNRYIPPRNQYNTLPPLLVMKMDIEGSEYNVLESLLKSGVSHKFDHILGEFHPYNNLSNTELSDLRHNLTTRLQLNGGPGFLQFDDEEYLHDGMEYPLPTKS